MTGLDPQRATSSRSGAVVDLFKGLLSTFTVVALLFGVPWLLLSVIGMPIGELVAELSDPLSSDNARAGAALRLGLSAVVWLAWVQAAWALMVELAAAILGRAAGRSRLVFPVVQRSARNLVATAMMLVTSFTAPASASTVVGLHLPPVDSAADAVTSGHGSSPGLELWSDHGGSGIEIPMVDVEAARAEVTGGGSARPAVAHGAPSSDHTPGPTSSYTVRPGDSLWSIAETTAGDGFAWRAIREHNLGRVMSDGSPITAATETVSPGTVLVVPGSGAADSADEGPISSESIGGRVEVEPGDHFWALAEETLAEAWGRAPAVEEITPYWSDMIELNRDRLLPPGDPDLIHPGQRFLTPALPDDPTAAATTKSRSFPPSSSSESLVPTDSTTVPAPTDSMTVPAPMESTIGPDPADSTTGPSPTEPPTAEAETFPRSSAFGVPQTYSAPLPGSDGAPSPAEPGRAGDQEPVGGGYVPFGVVAITGLGLLTAAVARIIRLRQSRRMGMRVEGGGPDFSPPTMAEQLLTTTADEKALDDLDTALRHIAAELEHSDLAAPELVGAMVGTSSIRLLLGSRLDAAPAPFRCERNGMIWTADRPVGHGDVGRSQGPYPALVTMGYTDSAQLLIDLEYVGVMTLGGGLADVIDTMGTMAFELATSPLADTVEVVCVGFGEELSELERITVVPTIDVALERVEAHAGATAELAADSDLNGPQGRVSAVGDWTPLVVFDPLSDLSPATERLLAAANRTQACGVAAVVTTADPGGLAVQLSEKQLSIPAYDIRLSRRILTRAQRAELAAALADATDPRHIERPDLAALVLAADRTAGSDREPAATGEPASSVEVDSSLAEDEDKVGSRPPSPSTDGDETTSHASPPVVVRLLGPLRVETGDGEAVVFDRSATPEFLAYLTHRRRGVGVDEAMNTLWPATTARRTWISNVHADARRTLVDFVDDEAAPRVGADDRYRLSDAVVSDLELFRRGVEAAVDLPVQRAVDVLVGALELVEGVPYTNVTNRWPMTEGHWQEATMLVDEAARCVATLALDHLDDPRLASWAAAKGLLASPHSVALHRLRLQAAMTDGGDELGPDAVFQHYQAMVMADEHRPEGGARLDPAIVELYESYRRSRTGVGAEWAGTSSPGSSP